MKKYIVVVFLLLFLTVAFVCYYSFNPCYWPAEKQSGLSVQHHNDDTIRIAYIGDSWADFHKNIRCVIDRKTRVISISVQDQDPLVCATMADSVKAHLQSFIIRYRTSKVSEDVNHYQQMRDSAEVAYDLVMDAYSRFCDAHKNVVLQSFQSERDKLESELAIKQNTLSAMETQLQATKVKMQEKTPAFTTLKSAIVPIKPAGPKRMLFVAGMLILVTILSSLYIIYKDKINVFVSRH